MQYTTRQVSEGNIDGCCYLTRLGHLRFQRVEDIEDQLSEPSQSDRYVAFNYGIDELLATWSFLGKSKRGTLAGKTIENPRSPLRIANKEEPRVPSLKDRDL